jgi:hypothetical protein
MVVLIDDPKMTDQLAEFLLQIQGGFSQGSLKGTDTPRGSIILTSNSKETDRYIYECHNAFRCVPTTPAALIRRSMSKYRVSAAGIVNFIA